MENFLIFSLSICSFYQLGFNQENRSQSQYIKPTDFNIDNWLTGSKSDKRAVKSREECRA